MERAVLERQIAERVNELADLQSRFDAHSAETAARSNKHFVKTVIRLRQRCSGKSFFENKLLIFLTKRRLWR